MEKDMPMTSYQTLIVDTWTYLQVTMNYIKNRPHPKRRVKFELCTCTFFLIFLNSTRLNVLVQHIQQLKSLFKLYYGAGNDMNMRNNSNYLKQSKHSKYLPLNQFKKLLSAEMGEAIDVYNFEIKTQYDTSNSNLKDTDNVSISNISSKLLSINKERIDSCVELIIHFNPSLSRNEMIINKEFIISINKFLLQTSLNIESYQANENSQIRQCIAHFACQYLCAKEKKEKKEKKATPDKDMRSSNQRSNHGHLMHKLLHMHIHKHNTYKNKPLDILKLDSIIIEENMKKNQDSNLENCTNSNHSHYSPDSPLQLTEREFERVRVNTFDKQALQMYPLYPTCNNNNNNNNSNNIGVDEDGTQGNKTIASKQKQKKRCQSVKIEMQDKFLKQRKNEKRKKYRHSTELGKNGNKNSELLRKALDLTDLANIGVYRVNNWVPVLCPQNSTERRAMGIPSPPPLPCNYNCNYNYSQQDDKFSQFNDSSVHSCKGENYNSRGNSNGSNFNNNCKQGRYSNSRCLAVASSDSNCINCNEVILAKAMPLSHEHKQFHADDDASNLSIDTLVEEKSVHQGKSINSLILSHSSSRYQSNLNLNSNCSLNSSFNFEKNNDFRTSSIASIKDKDCRSGRRSSLVDPHIQEIVETVFTYHKNDGGINNGSMNMDDKKDKSILPLAHIRSLHQAKKNYNNYNYDCESDSQATQAIAIQDSSKLQISWSIQRASTIEPA